MTSKLLDTMNFSTLFGFLICAAILAFSVLESQGAKAILLNSHAILIVCGGTLAATIVSFPLPKVIRLSFLACKRILGARRYDYQSIIREVISASAITQSNPSPDALKMQAAKVTNLFLREGLELLANGVTEEQLSEIMGTRIDTFKRRHQMEAKMFQTIGKFPPAFGLLGTTLGMITLLNQLGGADAQKLVGPAMAIGLVATLYGIALANFIFIPISENLTMLSSEDHAARKMILQGLIMLKRKMHPILVEESMKSFLLPSERPAISQKVA